MPDYLEVAIAAARQAGAIVREGYGQALQITHKGAIDLVTEYDRRSETVILGALRAAFPSHGISAEESGHAAGDEHEWLVDPLDGTTNFAHGFPVFSISLALTHRRQLVLGVVYDPLRDELFTAQAGQGASLNGAPLKVSGIAELGQALLSTGFPYDVRTNPHNNLAEFTRFQMQAQGIRRTGSAALDCGWVAAGRLDGFWEFRLNPWDVGAGALLVREAGGQVTTREGDADFLGRPSVVASNGFIHQQMLDVLQMSTAI
jgi:myo-inositol-1(or 4)-monophosphatase